jgi:hypothetical protein
VIRNLTIERFKSLKSLRLECRKVNVFIGPPDTGKTNILEALCLLSRLGWGLPLDTSLRLRGDLGFDALFYRQFFDQPIRLGLEIGGSPTTPSSDYPVTMSVAGQDRRLKVATPTQVSNIGFGQTVAFEYLKWIRYYSYTNSQDWQYTTPSLDAVDIVMPPNGGNLLYITRHNSRVYDFLRELLSGLDWKLRFDQAQKVFRLSEVRSDEILDYNLDLLSDSLKRLFFYSAILLTSTEAALVLDEPDVFAFPPYPKTLGEMIGGDTSNQFFLTTHNPYFLTAIVEKTPVDQLAVYVCDRDPERGTSARLLQADDLSQVVEQGASIFFNLAELGR